MNEQTQNLRSELQAIKADVERWPKWMKESAHFEGKDALAHKTSMTGMKTPTSCRAQDEVRTRKPHEAE